MGGRDFRHGGCRSKGLHSLFDTAGRCQEPHGRVQAFSCRRSIARGFEKSVRGSKDDRGLPQAEILVQPRRLDDEAGGHDARFDPDMLFFCFREQRTEEGCLAWVWGMEAILAVPPTVKDVSAIPEKMNPDILWLQGDELVGLEPGTQLLDTVSYLARPDGRDVNNVVVGRTSFARPLLRTARVHATTNSCQSHTS